MLFKKHHIVIFKESFHNYHGHQSRLRISVWLAILLLFLVALLIVSNVWLVHEYFQNKHLASKNINNEKLLSEQNDQLLSLHAKIQNLTRAFTRIERFDSKIRRMLELDSKLGSVNSERNDKSLNTSLPLHRPNLMARRMQNFLHLLENDLTLEEVNQQDILNAIRLKQKKLASSPSIWPIHGRVTSNFGYRRAPFGGGIRLHRGIDIKGAIGAPIIATAMGRVAKSGYSGAYGIVVEINHGAGVVTKYAHLQKSLVRVGQEVKRGEVIGRVGMTGRTTGSHLHYEVVIGGVPRNPRKYMLD